MNADGDYGHDNTDDNTDDHTDQEEDPSMTNPQPEQPAIEPPRRNRGFYAPNLTGDQMNTIWPDLARITNSDNAIAPRERHLTAVPDPGTVATVEPDSFTPTDIDDDPTVAAALHVRALVLFWWRTATVAVVVIITAAVAFTTASVAVGIAWTAYGTGWVAYSTWTAYGRPRGRDLYTGYRARRSA